MVPAALAAYRVAYLASALAWLYSILPFTDC
jgi:hypothetical protein